MQGDGLALSFFDQLDDLRSKHILVLGQHVELSLKKYRVLLILFCSFDSGFHFDNLVVSIVTIS